MRNKAEDHRGREEKMKKTKTKKKTNHKRLLISGNKLRVAGREGWGGDGMAG